MWTLRLRELLPGRSGRDVLVEGRYVAAGSAAALPGDGTVDFQPVTMSHDGPPAG